MSEIKIYDKIVFKRIEDIIPYENNARVNDRAVKALANAIPRMGFNVPIVIDKHNVIIKGHSRYFALKQMGYEAIPCIVSDDDDKDAAEERLVDNKTSEQAIWDSDKLNQELREMKIDLREMEIDVPAVRNGVDQIRDVTQEDIQRAQTKMIDNRTSPRDSQDLIEVHCDSCGEAFFINYEEVRRNA